MIKLHSLSGKKTLALFVIISLNFAGFVGGDPQRPLIFLPGTQPGQVAPADSVGICFQCHETQPSPGNHVTTIFSDWQGSMMAHSARDPIFFAALAVANKYNDVAGEFCIRCHSPTGWLAGHSKNPDGIDLFGSDFDGVQCDYCHRSAHPLFPDSTVPVTNQIPGFGNGMHAVQEQPLPRRGPYSDATGGHDVLFDSFQRTGELCGVCHNVSNPYYTADAPTRSPHEYGPIERTYSEWVLSWYATQGDAGTCQGCHMTRSAGYGCTLSFAPERSDLAQHDLTGGNTFVPDILPLFWQNLDTLRLQAGKQRATATLQRAADFAVVAGHSGDSVLAQVRITNLTGHKLPTGYPEGRRMWINLTAFNLAGDTVFQSGRYDTSTGVLGQDNQLKIYEMKHGLTDSIAQVYNVPPGPSFHFILNDTIFFDNRIPPRGFSNAEFQQHLAEPVGYAYADDQYWDITQYVLPMSAATVQAKVYYQTASKEYIEFLRDENVGNIHDWNHWGDSLYSAWSRMGKSRPVIMNVSTVGVQDSFPVFVPVEDKPIPVEFALFQNFPNPFNPVTKIEFSLTRSAHITLKLYDVLGREVQTLAEGRFSGGLHAASVDGSRLPSGMYMYRMNVEGRQLSKKLLLLK